MIDHNRGRWKAEHGFVTLMWTLTMLLIVIPGAGLAIDGGIAYFIKGKLQTACDAAALGAARSLSRGQDIPSQVASATDTAKRYYHANFPNNWMGVTPVNDPTVTWPAAPPATAIINVQGDVDAPTWFMRILRVNSIHFSVVGQATRRNVNVILLIDRSTSLADTGSCPALAADAKLFVQTFSNNRDRMGLLTYGTYFNLDSAPSYDFQTSMSTMLDNLQCSGFTNAAAAYTAAYQTLKALGDLNALNVLVFFTDGIPNTLTFGPDKYAWNGVAYGAGSPVLPLKPGSSCTATPGFSGVISGDVSYSVTGGIFKATNATYPAPSPFPGDVALIGSAQGYNGGCAFPSNPLTLGSSAPGFAPDVAYLPSTDAMGNGTDTSLLGGTGFPAATLHYTSGTYTGKIRSDDRQTIENAGINALDNAAQRARVDAAGNNMPFIVYTVGLGNAPGGVNNALLQRLANDPNSATHQSAYTDGMYMYSPDTAHLSSAFAAIASDILRLSK